MRDGYRTALALFGVLAMAPGCQDFGDLDDEVVEDWDDDQVEENPDWDDTDADPDWDSDLPGDDGDSDAVEFGGVTPCPVWITKGNYTTIRSPDGKALRVYDWWLRAVKLAAKHTNGIGPSYYTSGQANLWAMAQIGCKESGWRLDAKNSWSHNGRHPYGIYQMLWYGRSTGQPDNSRDCVRPGAHLRGKCNRTWLPEREQAVRAYWQVRAAMFYMKKRYGSARNAWDFWRRNNYY